MTHITKTQFAQKTLKLHVNIYKKTNIRQYYTIIFSSIKLCTRHLFASTKIDRTNVCYPTLGICHDPQNFAIDLAIATLLATNLAAWGYPVLYFLEGLVIQGPGINDSAGFLANMGISVGSPVSYSIIIDLDAIGDVISSDGTVNTKTDVYQHRNHRLLPYFVWDFWGYYF